MPKSAVSTIIKLAVASLLVGFALVLFGIEPADLVKGLGSTVVEIYSLVLEFLRASMKYVLIGAVVVVPIWGVFFRNYSTRSDQAFPGDGGLNGLEG